MTFQCKDGGWAAFDKDCTKNILEKVPFADHNAMLDPECADITARILELLGYEGWSTSHPQVKEALDYIRAQQEAGRFVVWPLGRELHLRHLAGVARAARAESRHESALAAQGAGLAGKRPARGRRLGRTLQHLRRPGLQRPGPEHRVANRLGRHGLVRVRRSGPPEPPARHRIPHPHPKPRRFMDGSTKPPAPVSRRCFI